MRKSAHTRFEELSDNIVCPVTDAYKEFIKCTVVFGLSNPNDPTTGAVFALDPEWARIWPYLDGKKTIRDLYQILLPLSDGLSPQQLETEFINFIEELKDNGLIFLIPPAVTRTFDNVSNANVKACSPAIKRRRTIHRILLINPPSGLDLCGRAPVLTNSAPPLGLLYIASSLLERGFDVNILDLSLKRSTGNAERILTEYKPDLIGITSTSAQFPWAISLLDQLKKADKELPIAMGGIHPSLCPEEAFRAGADFVIGREGDATMPLLVDSLNQGLDPTKNEGVWCCGRINGFSPQIQQLDDLPFPSRELLEDFHKYRHSGGIITSRGCPYKCNWCSSIFRNSAGLPVFRRRSPANVLKEIAHIKRSYGITEIQFQDDSFTSSAAWVRAFLAELKTSGLDISWGAQGNIANFVKDTALAYEMYDMGMRSIFFGIETADPSLFNKAKHSSLKESLDTLHKLNDLPNLNVLASFIIGHPGDTAESIAKTRALAADLLRSGIDVQVNVLNPFPGSPVLNDKDLTVIDKGNTLNYLFRKVNISTKNLSREDLIRSYADTLFELACIDDPDLLTVAEGHN